jgi:hypothetical protein
MACKNKPLFIYAALFAIGKILFSAVNEFLAKKPVYMQLTTFEFQWRLSLEVVTSDTNDYKVWKPSCKNTASFPLYGKKIIIPDA